jgi:prepilin-type N-terminal cleavage/methylation domain-containing protein
MKKEMKKNNKGFSLVELIVVVAIMAVLMTVLAPTLLRYVESSRQQKDESAVAEVINAVNLALADETVNGAVSNKTTIVCSGTGASGSITTTDDTSSALLNEIHNSIADTSLKFTSKAHSAQKYVITLDDSNGSLQATAYNTSGWQNR